MLTDAEKLLRFLYREYNGTDKMHWELGDLAEFAERCDISPQNFENAEKNANHRGWTQFGLVNHLHFIDLNPEGIDYAENKWKHWLTKIRDSFREHPEYWIPPIVVGIVVGALTFIISKLWG